MRPIASFITALVIIASPAAAATIQQDFDAAQALLDAGKASEARDAFSALLARLPPASKGKAANLVRARLGNALIATGNSETAEPLLATAAASFTGATAQDREERGVALYDLSRAREAQGKLDSAAKAYAEVRDAQLFPVDQASDIGLRAALARTLIWSNPAEARRLLDALLALPPEKLGKSKDTRALLQTLRGRVELNNGNAAEAKRWFTQAARTAGGAETMQVSIADVRIRSDLALANYKLNRMDEVQKAVAFSGSGGLYDEGMRAAKDMPLPSCAPLTGLAPDAVAVVEFALQDNGRVTGVTPVYADRGSGTAVPGVTDDGPDVLFAQAVRQWVWSTADVAKLNPFWRQSIRAELRCFTARPDADPVYDSFDADFTAWAASAGLQPLPSLPDNDAEALPMIRAELARREAKYGKQSLNLIGPLAALVNNDAAPEAERSAASARRLGLLVTAQAPPAVIGPAQIININRAASTESDSGRKYRVLRERLAALLAGQQAAALGASRVAMWTRLELAAANIGLKSTPDAQALLEQVITAPDALLPDGDPIRTKALLYKSNLAAAAKDTVTAASALAATGLSPEQCSLIDVRPQAINTAIGSSAFPDEAARWHTGGYARVGYDIAADGSTRNVRTLIAMPPFIFGPATEKAISRFKYQPVFRPGNTIGCSGSTQGVAYKPG